MMFNTVAIHPFTECDMNCPFCYKDKNTEGQKPIGFFVEMIQYLDGLTEQVAIGGGEPFLKPDFIRSMAHECRKHKIICNVTTNGRPLMKIPVKKFYDYLSEITMISISFDRYKIQKPIDLVMYLKLANVIKQQVPGIEVGCNLLVDEKMLKYGSFLKLIKHLFALGINRVFALYPKNIKGFDITKYSLQYEAATLMHRHFYVDDLTRKLLAEGYEGWHRPCHYGDKFISINEQGAVTGCSFDDKSKAVLVLDKPEDILKIKDIKMEKRYHCPYLNMSGIDVKKEKT